MAENILSVSGFIYNIGSKVAYVIRQTMINA